MLVNIKGVYQTKFGELWNLGLSELMQEAGEGAIKDAGIDKDKVDLVVVGNKLGGRLSNQNHLGCLAAEGLGLRAAAVRVEAACASGGLAVHQAVTAIEAGRVETVLVIGAEKMTDKSNGEVTEALMGAASWQERQAGLSFVGLYALLAQAYMNKFGASRRDLARIAVKNHKQGSKNEKAQFRKVISLAQALSAPMVAEPLGLFDCSPISDGAAAVVVQQGKGEVEVAASEVGMDSLGLCERKSLVELRASREAGEKAYQRAGLGVDEIEAAEVHDCFTIAEILAKEDLGFCQKGEGFKQVDKRVNRSGGLKACGHPVGATGVKQIVDLVKWIRQGEIKIGLAHNVGGSGGTAVVHILRRGL